MSALQTFLRNNAPSFTPNSGSSRGSVGPTLQKNCNRKHGHIDWYKSHDV